MGILFYIAREFKRQIIMLNNRDYGYAVMNKELTAYSFEDISLESCKRYCRNGDVIVKKIPYVAGFSVRVMWYKYDKPFEFKKRYGCNILWLHINWHNEYLHKNGEIVFKSI